MIGSSRPRQDKVSLIDSQNANEFSVTGPEAGRIGVLGPGGADAGGAGAGGEPRWGASVTCEGSVATAGKAVCDAEVGAIVATIAESLSIFLSKSRIRLGGWPSPLDFAGLRRATCSMHSTLAFWHLHSG